MLKIQITTSGSSGISGEKVSDAPSGLGEGATLAGSKWRLCGWNAADFFTEVSQEGESLCMRLFNFRFPDPGARVVPRDTSPVCVLLWFTRLSNFVYFMVTGPGSDNFQIPCLFHASLNMCGPQQTKNLLIWFLLHQSFSSQ